METRKISIHDLKPAEYNPRIMPSDEMDKLTTSLRTFGLVDPIIIDLTDNNTIIGGHQRYEALIHLDEEELTLIPLGDIGLVINETSIRIKDKNDQKALNIALNKIQGEWDYEKLDTVLDDLITENYQIELTGFDKTELDTITDEFDINEFLNFEDDDEEDTPEDYQDITGDIPDKNYMINLIFKDKETAEKYMHEKIGVNHRITKLSHNLHYGTDFNF